MKLRTRRQWFGGSLLLLVTAVAILCYCLWQSVQVRSQMSAITDFTLTLTRLAQLNADAGNSSAPLAQYSADAAARLVAAGDVQSRALQQLVATDAVGVLREQGAGLVSRWASVRRAFSELNLSSQSAAVAASADTVATVEVVGLRPVVQSYEALFAAIVGESLSQPLLLLASEIRGQLTGLDILSAESLSGNGTRALVLDLKAHAQQLEEIAHPQNGPSILGYQSTRKLKEFLQAADGLDAIETPALPSQPATADETNARLSDTTAESLDTAQSLLLVMDAALAESRRNVLLASLLFSLCLLLSAMLALSVRRHTNVADDRKQNVLSALYFDMNKLASGELTHLSTVPKDTPKFAALAAAFNQTAAAMADVQQLSRHKLDQASALAKQQQQVIDVMEERLVELVQNSSITSEKFNAQLAELREWIESFTAAFTQQHAELESQVTGTASALARLTAQLELCDGRVVRAMSQIHSLRDTVDKIEDCSRQASLQALNESIKHSAYYDGSHEPEKFVESAQRASHQLQLDAGRAAQEVVAIHTDLDACANALRECLAAAQESAERVGGASRVMRSGAGVETSGVDDLHQLHSLADELAVALQQATAVNRASLPEEELLHLKGHTLELQLLAAEFDESNSEQQSLEDQTR